MVDENSKCPAEELIGAVGVAWPTNERIDNIAHNGNDGQHYGAHHIELEVAEVGARGKLDFVITPDNFVGKEGRPIE